MIESLGTLLLVVTMTATDARPAPDSTRCMATSGPRRALLVELYTSEGCSSCPPADRWLARLPLDQGLIPLAFHVDYWDWIGWEDRFGDAAYSQRQRRQVAQRGARAVYTPQVFVGGRELVRWYEHPQPSMQPGAAPQLRLAASSTDPGRLDYQVGWQGSLEGVELQLALVQNRASTAVPAGENAGRTLQHAHIVRALQRRPLRAVDRGELVLPADLPLDDATLVAWVEGQDGHHWQAVRLGLACAAVAPSTE